MKSIGSFVHNLAQQLKPRTGNFHKETFSPESSGNVVADAVKFTNDTHQGDIHLSHEESARVRFANGSSLSSDGNTVSVTDPSGKQVRQFTGTVDVTDKSVKITSPAAHKEQTFGADGSNIFFDNGRIVQIEGDKAHSIFPNGEREEGQVGTAGVLFPGGDTASPLFSQDWLVSK